MNIVEKGGNAKRNLVEENEILNVEIVSATQLPAEELLIKKGDVVSNNSCLGIDKDYIINKSSKNKNGDVSSSLECKEISNQQSIFLEKNENPSLSCGDSEYFTQPLSERWSPLGANYDDLTNGTELLTPDPEMQLPSLDESCQKEVIMGTDPDNICRLRHLEEEQEFLTSSLLALTSHFAHVQLRVRQIVEASPAERDKLLKELDVFAFQGIPESLSSNVITSAPSLSSKDDTAIENIKSNQRQYDLIEYLKSQLSELEKLAYESGAPVLPQHIILKKQKVIIDELKNKLNLKVEDHELPQLSSEELRFHVENAIGEFVGPLKMKEQLVAQLKTQITDLERFIFFLQCDSDSTKMNTLNGSNNKLTGAYNSYVAKKKQQTSKELPFQDDYAINSLKPSCSRNATFESQGVRESLNNKAHGLMDKASVLMQMFASSNFGLKPDPFKKNTLKTTSKGNHWGDLRAQLEVDIQEVASLASTLSYDREKLKNLKQAKKSAKKAPKDISDSKILAMVQPFNNANKQAIQNLLVPDVLSSDCEDGTYDFYDWNCNLRIAKYKADSFSVICHELTTAVRQKFAMTLQLLIEHGLREEITSITTSIMIPFLRCFNPYPSFAAEHDSFRMREFGNTSNYSAHGGSGVSQKRNVSGDHGFRPMNAWELILQYYCLKNGDEFNNTPARKLSDSFNLDVLDSKVITAKQNLLTTIGSIINMHQPYKRSCNAHFKAFVCAALNSKQLKEWLELIFSCSNLIEMNYTSNSYVMRTGFRDSLRSIDILTKYDFDLPVDLAVRHFKNI